MFNIELIDSFKADLSGILRYLEEVVQLEIHYLQILLLLPQDATGCHRSEVDCNECCCYYLGKTFEQQVKLICIHNSIAKV